MSSKGITAYFCANRTLLQFMKKNVTVRQIRVFLHVALHGPVSLKELTKTLGGKPGTLYDDLQDLGKVGVSRKPGARLIEEVPPAVDGQGIIYRLSEHGRRAVEAVAMELETRLMPEEDDEPLEAYFASRALVRG